MDLKVSEGLVLLCFPAQGDLRRMWSEPFHSKSSSSRFLEVWWNREKVTWTSALVLFTLTCGFVVS